VNVRTDVYGSRETGWREVDRQPVRNRESHGAKSRCASGETVSAIFLHALNVRAIGRTSHTRQRGWGLPPRRKWHFDASQFAGVAPRDPVRMPDPYTLEKFLAEQAVS
jgi:hypothetical protein